MCKWVNVCFAFVLKFVQNATVLQAVSFSSLVLLGTITEKPGSSIKKEKKYSAEPIFKLLDFLLKNGLVCRPLSLTLELC